MNTSPLVLLSKIGLLDLLRAGDLPVMVPQAVVNEIARHGPEDQTLLVIRSAGWLQIVPDLPVPPQLDANHLGAGELAVLAVALAQPGSEVVLDDKMARRRAEKTGSPSRERSVLSSRVSSAASSLPSDRSWISYAAWACICLHVLSSKS